MIDRKQIDFARSHLGNKKDGSKTLIFDHAIRVHFFLHSFLKPYNLPPILERDIRRAGLFHDLLEDTHAKESDLLRLSSLRTLEIVREMTIDFSNKSVKQAVQSLYEASDYTILVKIADIYDNTRKSNFVIRVNGIEWYEVFFIPLLKEYRKIILFRKGIKGPMQKCITEMASLVLKEIDTHLRTVKIFKEIE